LQRRHRISAADVNNKLCDHKKLMGQHKVNCNERRQGSRAAGRQGSEATNQVEGAAPTAPSKVVRGKMAAATDRARFSTSSRLRISSSGKSAV